ncbi:MAG: hypothetical protein Q4E89_11990, partial [Eubacteriales bacterium]|nr:hypothetical protein [Eubacteriales bacterium]
LPCRQGLGRCGISSAERLLHWERSNSNAGDHNNAKSEKISFDWCVWRFSDPDWRSSDRVHKIHGIGTSNKSLGAIILFIALFIGFGKYVKQEDLNLL